MASRLSASAPVPVVLGSMRDGRRPEPNEAVRPAPSVPLPLESRYGAPVARALVRLALIVGDIATRIEARRSEEVAP